MWRFPPPRATAKTTYRVPRSMWHGVTALAEKLPALLVDFTGMKDYNAGMIVEMMQSRWPGVRALRIPFPQSFMGVDRPNLMLAPGHGIQGGPRATRRGHTTTPGR